MKSDYYKDGYLTGFEWSSDYQPGGPSRILVSNVDYHLWHRGFKHGLRVRNMVRAMGGSTVFIRSLQTSH